MNDAETIVEGQVQSMKMLQRVQNESRKNEKRYKDQSTKHDNRERSDDDRRNNRELKRQRVPESPDRSDSDYSVGRLPRRTILVPYGVRAKDESVATQSKAIPKRIPLPLPRTPLPYPLDQQQRKRAA